MTDTPMLFPRLRSLEVSAHLRRHEAEWRSLGVSRVRVFGSVARNEAHEASDVDVLVDFSGPAGLLDQVRVIWLFERLLGRRTDVVTEAALKPPLRSAVLEDAIDVFAPPADEVRPSPKLWRWRVEELVHLCERLQALTRGQGLASFRADRVAQDAACMNLLRLGEGTKFVPQELQDAHPELPWDELRAVRNLLAHDYFGLDVGLLWHTLSVELPPLRVGLEALLDSMQDSD